MLKILRAPQKADPAWTRVALVFALLVGLAMACSAGQKPDQQQATSLPPAGPTQNPLFLPEVQSGGSQATEGSASKPAGPNTLFLPQVSSGSGGPGSPQVQLEASPLTLKVGETVTVTGRVASVEKIIYFLTLQDAGTAEDKPLAQVNSANEAQALEGSSQVLELLTAEGNPDTATFVLRAKAPGTTLIQLTVSGEIQAEGGASPWSGVASQPITITVTE